MDKNKLKIGAGIAVLAVLLLGVAGAQAMPTPGTFLERLAYFAGFRLGDRLADEVQMNFSFEGPALPEEASVGAAGDAFATQPMAQVLVVTSTEPGTDTASSSFGVMLNPTAANGGRTRVVTELEFRALGTASTYLGGPLILDFGTTTAQFSSSSDPIYSVALVTSTDAGGVKIATSTFTQRWKSLWKPGEYLKCQTNRVVSTTGGYCVAKYLTLE